MFCRTCVRVLSRLGAQSHVHAVEEVPEPGEDGCGVCAECVASEPCSQYARRDAASVIGLKARPMTSIGMKSSVPGTFAPIT